MYAAPPPSPLRFAFAVVTWLVAMGMLAAGGIVGGTGRVVLTVLAIVLLVLAVAYVTLQIWYLNRAQRGPRPAGAKPDQEVRPPR
jgi:predicted Kef-type K+ transport protein